MQAIWIGQTEGVRFWLRLMDERKGCGVTGILIAAVGKLKRFLEAMANDPPPAIYSNTRGPRSTLPEVRSRLRMRNQRSISGSL